MANTAITVAAVDRMVDHSSLIQINGESYRRRRAKTSMNIPEQGASETG